MNQQIDTNIKPAPQAFSQKILLEKYALEGETSIADIQMRVARALSKGDEQYQRFLNGLTRGFVPGGRINSAAGAGLKTTMINCFVQPVGDAMSGKDHNGLPGIMDALRQSAETMRRSGGVGYDFSPIRPVNAYVKGTNSFASGPLSFMRIFDSMCETVESAGKRRGAQMGILRVDHPDIVGFVDAKKTPDFGSLGLDQKESSFLLSLLSDHSRPFSQVGRKAFSTFRNFNLSVAVTDEFMEAVVSDSDFDLVHEAEPRFEAKTKVCSDGKTRYVYKTIKARDLWKQIMWNTYNGAEPGVIFIDRVNKDNNLWYVETIRASNPCGEQMLPDYGACDLGSMMAHFFVKDPFTEKATFQLDEFAAAVAIGVELLDRVLDETIWPLPEQQLESQNKRRIGLGYTGLADAMAMLGIRYDSAAGVEFTRVVSEKMRDAAYMASVELAKKFGPFPLFDAEKYLKEGTFASRLPEHIKAAIREHGIRNSHLLSLAPTGTISMAFGDNCASGIEPIFAINQIRTQRTGANSSEDHLPVNGTYRHYVHVGGDQDKADVFVTAMKISVKDHLKVLEAAAPFIDSAISKTVNVPVDYPFEDFEDVYMSAWKIGLKGITTYRPNAIVGSVIADADDVAKAVAVEKVEEGDPLYMAIDNRPEGDLEGVTSKVVYWTTEGKQSLYLTVNFAKVKGMVDGQEVEIERPIEIFVPSSQLGNGQQWVSSHMVQMSLNARYGGPVSKSLKNMRKVVWEKGAVRCGTYTKSDGTKIPRFHDSDVAAIGYAIQQILEQRGFLDTEGNQVPSKQLAARLAQRVGVRTDFGDDDVTSETTSRSDSNGAMLGNGMKCPECGSYSLHKRDGCKRCDNCGHMGECG